LPPLLDNHEVSVSQVDEQPFGTGTIALSIPTASSGNLIHLFLQEM